jgi:hypothetical protein
MSAPEPSRQLSEEPGMLLELARPLSFFLSMLSLYPVIASAFFVPGTRWEERLSMALLRVTMAACVCIASGILYSLPEPRIGAEPQTSEPLLSTLPVRLFFCAIGGMSLLFLLSWWLDTYYVPLLHHGCCRP